MASSASISALPTELVVFVADNLDRLKDLASLALVDRKFYNTVNSILYRRAASRRDAWPLAWAAHCGVAGTLRKVLAAGIDPNHQFVDGMLLDEWKKYSAEARLAVHENADNEVWDTDNECDSNADLSPETQDSDHATTIDTNQPPSNSNSDPWGNAFNDSDRDISDVSMDGPNSPHSDADSSTLDDLEEDGLFETYVRAVERRFNPIHLAARGGHNDIIEILLEYGASINTPSECLCDCTRLYGLLNAAECPEDEQPPPAWSPLHIALCHSHPETAKLLLSRGASSMMELPMVPVLSYGNTALHHAAAMGLVDVVEYLLDNNIQTEVDVRDEKTLTPLYHAYAKRRWDSTVPLLLERGANINVDTKMFLPYSTITPLGEACRLGDFDEADRLLELGADPTHGFIATSTGGGLSPLHMCCMPSAQPVSEVRTCRRFEEDGGGARRMRTIEKLVARGALLEAKDCSGDTPLIIAAQHCNVPALRAVIRAGADIHQRNGVGRNAIMQAIVGPSQPMHHPTTIGPVDINPLALTLGELLRNGARLDERDSEGNTILHVVFKDRLCDLRRQTATLRILFNMPGAAVLGQVRNKDGHTPLKLAFQVGNLEACDVLVRKGCLHGEIGRVEIVDMFKHAINFTDPQKAFEFVLDLDTSGVLTSDPGLFSELLAGGRVQVLAAQSIGQRGIPPASGADLTRFLCQTLRAGEYDLAYSILEAGADVDGSTGDGQCPLAVFVMKESRHKGWFYLQFLEALLDRGANIHLPFSSNSPQRILNKIITLEMEEELTIMLKKKPLANDTRAVGGFYLHDAVVIASPQQPPNEKIIDLLLSSGASNSEINGDGDTPLSALLKSLCKQRHFTWRYHRYIKRLSGPEVDINRQNAEGKSIADYLEILMQKNAQPDQTTFLTRRIQLVDSGSGVKVLKFLPRPHKRVKPGAFMGQ